MPTANAEKVRIGRFEVPIQRASDWIGRYTNAHENLTSAEPYAYPAYDQYNAVYNSATVLHDADFLAPTLLNVSVGIRSFYGLQRLRDRLQRLLEPNDLARPLAELADDRIADLVGSLYAVLDDPGTKPWGVNGTTLSKVLHRKRPTSLALHDKWVRVCYLGPGAPVPRAKLRSWAEYMTLVSQAMASDLHNQPLQFSVLQLASKADPALTDLRLLDIVAWNVGQCAFGRRGVT